MFTRAGQWPFQEPKLEVPTIYKAYFSGQCKGISPQNMAKHMLQYLHQLDPGGYLSIVMLVNHLF